MKRLFKKLCIFFTPFLILTLLFFVFEPFDYFLLRGDAPYSAKPLSSMREVIRNKPDKIILGDSRMANLNTDYIKEITGEDYTMLGFGGSTVGECVALFWFATEHTTLTEVVFGVGFYTSANEQTAGRIPHTEKQATNIFSFYSNSNNWLSAINNAKEQTVNAAAQLFNQPAWITYPEDPQSTEDIPVDLTWGSVWRKNLEDFANLLYSNLERGYTLEKNTLDMLGEVIDYCNANGIKITFVFPPMHDSVYVMVTGPLGIDPYREQYKKYLIRRATVFDFEFRSAFSASDSNFYDGFHLTGTNKKWLAEMIFTDAASENVIRYYRD